MLISSDESPLAFPSDSQPWTARVDALYIDDFNDTSSVAGRLQLDTASRFGIDTEWNYRHEDLPNGEHDDLWTGDFNVVYRFAQSEHWQFRSGLGFNWLSDESDSEFGWNLTYGFDAYPIKPIVFSTSVDLGRLGREGLQHVRTTIGIQLKRLQIYAGYDLYQVGSVEIDGFISGLQLSF